MSTEDDVADPSGARSHTGPAEGDIPLDRLEALKHVVVLMFENRSFDNIFGYLYPSNTLPDGQHFEGIADEKHFNIDIHNNHYETGKYKYDYKTAMTMPNPDPGEEYQHVNTQIFGMLNPTTNAGLPAQEMKAPYNYVEHFPADMYGFVVDYYYNVLQLTKSEAKAQELCGNIMCSFDPDMLPVLSTLARGFAVYDHWFSAVPSQTFCNRAFFHASTSSGFVTNLGKPGVGKWETMNPVKTIFNLLEEHGKTWAIYFDASQRQSITRLINDYGFKSCNLDNFFSMTKFYEDVKNGALPDYAFIEPRQFFDHNDMHPPITFDADGREVTTVYDMAAGEYLLHEVYSAIRASDNRTGSNAMNTTLLVTFDEHGGTFDHVRPPKATPPQRYTKGSGQTECDFLFDRLGVRVPTIAISAYTREGTVINDEMHHGALIATLCKKHGMGPLTDRDRGARDITNAFNLVRPRLPRDWPETKPRSIPPEPRLGPFTEDAARTPLTPPARSMLQLLVEKYGEPGEKPPETYGEAYALVQRLPDICSE